MAGKSGEDMTDCGILDLKQENERMLGNRVGRKAKKWYFCIASGYGLEPKQQGDHFSGSDHLDCFTGYSKHDRISLY